MRTTASGIRRAGLGLSLVAALVAAAGCGERHAAIDPERLRAAEAGAGLFDGRTPLSGQIRGHEAKLPAAAAVCANCHERSAVDAKPRTVSSAGTVPDASVVSSASAVSDARADAGAARAESFGPVLDAASLTTLRSRRGAPASRFDQASFCRILRTGEDPAHVLLPRVMPRYDIDDEGCAALWQHLTLPADAQPVRARRT